MLTIDVPLSMNQSMNPVTCATIPCYQNLFGVLAPNNNNNNNNLFSHFMQDTLFCVLNQYL